MGLLRLVTHPQSATVVPLRPLTDTDDPATEPSPEPRQLYDLIVLALVLHQPIGAHCACCAKAWPCEQLRLACRLRDGF